MSSRWGFTARRRWGGAVAAAVLVGAAGCGAHPGTVAYVGSEQVSQAELDAAVAGVEQTLEPGQRVAVGAVVNVLIHGEIAEQIAADRSIPVTDAARDKVLATSNLAPLLQVPAAKAVAYDVATQQIVAEKVGAQAYLAEVAKFPVKLNPRFGLLNEQEKTVVESSSGSLSEPVDAATP